MPPGCSTRSPSLIRSKTKSVRPPGTRQYRVVLLSALVHALLLAAVGMSARRDVSAMREEVTVELVTEIPRPREDVPPSSPRIERAPAAPVELEAKRHEPDAGRQPTPGPQENEPPRQALRSRSILSDPRSKQAREVLGRTEPFERATQICNLEVMAQINGRERSQRADFVNAEATAPVQIRDSDIEAAGAAYRSRDKWFRLRFTCKLNRAGDEVVDIRFTPGAPIPRRDWEKYSLMIDDHPMHD